MDYWVAKIDEEQQAKPQQQQMKHEDRLKAAKNAHRAHMLRLAKASAEARRRKASGGAA